MQFLLKSSPLIPNDQNTNKRISDNHLELHNVSKSRLILLRSMENVINGAAQVYICL